MQPCHWKLRISNTDGLQTRLGQLSALSFVALVEDGKLLSEDDCRRAQLSGSSVSLPMAQSFTPMREPNPSRIRSCGRCGFVATSRAMSDTSRSHLFLSYATEDALFVDWLCLRLLNEGYRVWCDRLKLLGGESYPNDIDDAIVRHAYRFIAVLSRSSIRKPNPLKERTSALCVARERRENFVIPLNLDGLIPSELGWMQSDLTYIPFSNWNDGLRLLLKNLHAAGTPKVDSPTSVAALLDKRSCVIDAPETLWSNLLTIKRIPARLYRYEHDVAMPASNAQEAQSAWAHFRENSSVCWSFQSPPEALVDRYRLSLRGTCDNWRTARGPDINFYNLGKKVLNSTLFHRLLSAGLRYDADNHYSYVPNDPQYGRLTFRKPTGSGWIKPVGVRSFSTAKGRVSFRYHLSPVLRAWLDFGNRDVVCMRTRLYLTELDGTPISSTQMQSRRKAICKSWWNHQWLSRILATLQLIASPEEEIRIGIIPDEQVVLERFTMSMTADRTLLESALKSKDQAEEFIDLIGRKIDATTGINIDEGEVGDADPGDA